MSSLYRIRPTWYAGLLLKHAAIFIKADTSFTGDGLAPSYATDIKTSKPHHRTRPCDCEALMWQACEQKRQTYTPFLQVVSSTHLWTFKVLLSAELFNMPHHAPGQPGRRGLHVFSLKHLSLPKGPLALLQSMVWMQKQIHSFPSVPCIYPVQVGIRLTNAGAHRMSFISQTRRKHF